MNIIVCVDKSNGMMFNNRRQSQDKELISKIIELTSGARLLMSEYSAQMFLGNLDIVANNDFISQAQSGDFAFIEETEIPNESIEDIYIFNWNRDYPADKYFDFDLKANGYKRVKKIEFAGNSHKKITLEIFRRA
jgi:hypothetical protein